MIFLWASIICSTSIYLTFKLRPNFKANLTGTIIINYFIATVLGYLIQPVPPSPEKILLASWFPLAALIGFLFVIIFLLIGWSSEKTGIALTTVATRMSMIIPILFSMLLFNEIISLSKIVKVVLVFIAVTLAIYKKPDKNTRLIYMLLPFILFIGSGSVDTLVKTAQHLYIPPNEIGLFSSSLFGISFIVSFLLLFKRKTETKLFSWNTAIVGLLLGLSNFGSLYFLINALNKSGIESSLVFGINNLTIVCLSLLFGAFLFKEKLSAINWTGIVFSIICIIILIEF